MQTATTEETYQNWHQPVSQLVQNIPIHLCFGNLWALLLAQDCPNPWWYRQKGWIEQWSGFRNQALSCLGPSIIYEPKRTCPELLCMHFMDLMFRCKCARMHVHKSEQKFTLFWSFLRHIPLTSLHISKLKEPSSNQSTQNLSEWPNKWNTTSCNTDPQPMEVHVSALDMHHQKNLINYLRTFHVRNIRRYVPGGCPPFLLPLSKVSHCSDCPDVRFLTC